MKRGIQIIILFAVIFGLSNCKKATNDIIYSKKYLEEIKAVRKEIGFFMASGFIPGANVAISKNGELIYSEGIGLASKELDAKATRATKFRIGSLSELFTSAMYFKMVEDGILHPDSSVQNYYPQFPEKKNRLNVNHLVNHVTGIREPYYEEKTRSNLNVNIEKGISIFMNEELIANPGVYQVPSKFNYNLLGVVMQKVKNHNFSKLFKSYLSDTLHLENTLIDNPYSTIKNRSVFYDHNMISQVVNATSIDLRQSAPSEGLLSTAEDLVKFGNALLSNNYFSEATRKKMFTKITLSNGVEPSMVNSWVLMQDNEGRPIYGKDGSVKGGSASILIYPEEKLVLAFASNLTESTNNLPVFKIAGHFLPKNEKTEEPIQE